MATYNPLTNTACHTVTSHDTTSHDMTWHHMSHTNTSTNTNKHKKHNHRHRNIHTSQTSRKSCISKPKVVTVQQFQRHVKRQPASVFSRVENTFFHRPQFETDIMFLTALRKLDFAHISTSLAHSREQTAICSLTSGPSSRLSPIFGFCVKKICTTPAQHSPPPCPLRINETNKTNANQ